MKMITVGNKSFDWDSVYMVLVDPARTDGLAVWMKGIVAPLLYNPKHPNGVAFLAWIDLPENSTVVVPRPVPPVPPGPVPVGATAAQIDELFGPFEPLE